MKIQKKIQVLKQLKINLAIVERFNAMGVEFAFPTRPFHLPERAPSA